MTTLIIHSYVYLNIPILFTFPYLVTYFPNSVNTSFILPYDFPYFPYYIRFGTHYLPSFLAVFTIIYPWTCLFFILNWYFSEFILFNWHLANLLGIHNSFSLIFPIFNNFQVSVHSVHFNFINSPQILQYTFILIHFLLIHFE